MDIASFIAGLEAGAGNGGSGVLDSVLDRSIKELVSNATSLMPYALYQCKALTSVYLPEATSIGTRALSECEALTSVHLPKATSIGDYALYNCKALTNYHIPEATSIGTRGFMGCSALTDVNFPKVTTLGSNAFSGCSLLTTAYFTNVNSIKPYTFNNCYSLRSLVLASTSVCQMEDRTPLGNCYHLLGEVNPTYNPNGDKDGYVYVPSALIESYKAAPFWEDYSALQFRALEDYTVDGTITGELDPNKI